MYSDADAAALYDLLNPWGPSDELYLASVMGAASVMDVGCGTGRLLHRARESGHRGRLSGIDPDSAALARARRRTDIEWVLGRARDIAWSSAFDLAVMASNAFQVLDTDEELSDSLTAISRALVTGGHFIFDTRNPHLREWQEWNPNSAFDIVDHHGRELRMVYQVESVEGGVVTLTETTATRDGTPLRVDRGRLRFLDLEAIASFLTDAGFEVDEIAGDWFHGPVNSSSRSFVVTAHRG